jgi:hypothetical protein
MVNLMSTKNTDYFEERSVEYLRVDEPVKICSIRFNARLFAEMKKLASKNNVSFNKFINDKLEEILSEKK